MARRYLLSKAVPIIKAVARRAAPVVAKVQEQIKRSVGLATGINFRTTGQKVIQKTGQLSRTVAPVVSRFGKVARVTGGVATAGLLGYSVYDAIRGSRASSGGSVGSSGAGSTSGVDTAGMGGETMGISYGRIAAGLAGAGALYGAEQLAENIGIRGGAGFIGDRSMSRAQVRRLTGFGGRRKTGLFNKRALRTMMKAKSYEKQAVRVLSKRGLVFKKRGSSRSASLDRNEIQLARMLYGGR